MTAMEASGTAKDVPPAAITTKEQLRQHISTILKDRDHALRSRISAAIAIPAPSPSGSVADLPSALWSATEIIETVLAFDSRHGETARLRRALQDIE